MNSKFENETRRKAVRCVKVITTHEQWFFVDEDEVLAWWPDGDEPDLGKYTEIEIYNADGPPSFLSKSSDLDPSESRWGWGAEDYHDVKAESFTICPKHHRPEDWSSPSGWPEKKMMCTECWFDAFEAMGIPSA